MKTYKILMLLIIIVLSIYLINSIDIPSSIQTTKEYKLISVSEPTKDNILLIMSSVPKRTITYIDENNNFQSVRDETIYDRFAFIYSDEEKVIKIQDNPCYFCVTEWKIYTSEI